MPDESRDSTDNKTFADLIEPGISKDEFIKLAAEQCTEKDKEVLGDDYEEIIRNLILCPSAAEPYPATSDYNVLLAAVN